MPNGVSRNAREVFRGSIPGWDFIIYNDNAPQLIISFLMQPTGYFVGAYYVSTFLQLESGLMLDADSDLYLTYDEVLEIRNLITRRARLGGRQGFLCPLCGRYTTKCPALSRRDNRTEICPDCGTLEALEDMARGGL